VLEGHAVWPQSHAKIKVESWTSLGDWPQNLDGGL